MVIVETPENPNTIKIGKKCRVCVKKNWKTHFQLFKRLLTCENLNYFYLHFRALNSAKKTANNWCLDKGKFDFDVYENLQNVLHIVLFFKLALHLIHIKLKSILICL